EVRPDLVVGIPAQAALVAPLRRAGVRVVLLPDDSYDDIFADLRALGTLSGHAAEARALIARLHTQVAQITARVPRGLQPRVFIVLGVDPIFTAGGHSYIDRLIAFAGGRNVAANLHVAYSRYSAEALVAAQPDVLIADSESGLGAVLSRPPWSLLRAVRRGRVAILRDPDLLDRPSPRFVDGLRWLVAKLHPVVPARRWPIAGVGADGVAP
ncbi:MAG: ABC transporter substrate-binding protein, partial [Candidatus Dormibacteria bacterium]